jgi:hypothetical protein
MLISGGRQGSAIIAPVFLGRDWRDSEFSSGRGAEGG